MKQKKIQSSIKGMNKEFTINELKLIASLKNKKYRDLHGLYLIEGEHLISELIKSLQFHPEQLTRGVFVKSVDSKKFLVYFFIEISYK